MSSLRLLPSQQRLPPPYLEHNAHIPLDPFHWGFSTGVEEENPTAAAPVVRRRAPDDGSVALGETLASCVEERCAACVDEWCSGLSFQHAGLEHLL